MKVQVLIPIAGYSSFFPKEEFYFPKPLVEVDGHPMIEVVIEELKRQLNVNRFFFVIGQCESRSFSLDRTLKLVTSLDSIIIEKNGETSGALSSCLLAIDELDPNQPLVIANSDQVIDDHLDQAISVFNENSAAAGVITFDSVHPRWSYVLDDGNGNVLQAFEKKVVSRNAIAGFYYYDSAKRFLNAASSVLLKNTQTDGVYYISSTLNEIILDGGLVRHFAISPSMYHSFYAPSKIKEYQQFGHVAKSELHLERKDVNVVIPAAGEGSRFAKLGWRKPKPFIDINGRPMVEHVIDNVMPNKGIVTLLLRQEHINSEPEVVHRLEQHGVNIKSVSQLTDGTASTVLLTHRNINNSNPLLIANSDQLVDFDINLLIDDCHSRGLDGSILVFKDRFIDPKWSFVELDNDGIVLQVAEKTPISDLATVGIYYFSKGSDFVLAAMDMIAANDRINNEFYTCPIYNYMISQGARIGTFEIPFDKMYGLGTPNDFINYLSSRGLPDSCDMPV
jgi:NDP-sugar pyrophosphorylase family protein